MVCLCVQDAYARGEVFIGSKESGYTALPGFPPNIQGSHWQFGITIMTPDREFLFACETEPNQKDWMAAFQTVINRPMLPQEYAGEPKFHLFVHPHTSECDLFFFFCTFSLQWRHISNTNHDWVQNMQELRQGGWHLEPSSSHTHIMPCHQEADQPMLKQCELLDLCYPVPKPGILSSFVVL